MPETKTTYLQNHQRTICPGCQFWVPWYRNKKGKQVYSCRLGLIPEHGYCRRHNLRHKQAVVGNE